MFSPSVIFFIGCTTSMLFILMGFARKIDQKVAGLGWFLMWVPEVASIALIRYMEHTPIGVGERGVGVLS